MISYLSHQGRVLHRVVDCKSVTAHDSISNAEEPLQVQVSLRRTGERPEAHQHLEHEKDGSEKIQESWYVVSGKLLCHLYDEQNEHLGSPVLEAGWLCVTYAGGHSFEVLEEAVLLEHKTGPYLGRGNDKLMFPTLQ